MQRYAYKSQLAMLVVVSCNVRARFVFNGTCASQDGIRCTIQLHRNVYSRAVTIRVLIAINGIRMSHNNRWYGSPASKKSTTVQLSQATPIKLHCTANTQLHECVLLVKSTSHRATKAAATSATHFRTTCIYIDTSLQ